jgi:prepilin-type N-terminal cleavage/methylation domain-containing protein
MPALISSGTPTVRRRQGFTLVEVMVALVLLALVVGGLMGVVAEQQKFYDGASDVMDLHDNLRRIGDLLPSDMRGMAPGEGDLISLSDSMIEFRAPSGTSVICAVNGGADVITLPPASLATDVSLTSWAAQPVVGDSLFILDSRASASDTLIARQITAALGVGDCPMSSGFTTTAAEASRGITITLDAALPATVVTGSPVRFFRRVKYSLYNEPTDGEWYLGFRDYVPGRASPWSAIQPVAGPLLSYSSGGASGLAFTYLDSAGVAITSSANAQSVRRIDIVARARSATEMRSSGLSRASDGFYHDSLRTTVALRNE